MLKRALVLALFSASFLLPTAAQAAPCEEGEGFGATAPPPRLQFLADRLPETGRPVTERSKIEATELSEAHAEWEADYNRHLRACEAQAAAERLAAEQSDGDEGETYVTGAYAIPTYVVMCESGGNPTAVNPSSGAYGLYQIIPSTAAAYGCDLSTIAGQHSCAREILANQGPSAWTCW